MEITLGSRWKQGETVMKVVALTSDGEVGYRMADKAPRANGDGLMGEWPDHHCKVDVFLAQHTPVMEAPSPELAVVAELARTEAAADRAAEIAASKPPKGKRK